MRSNNMNDMSEEAKRELLSRFMEFSGQTIACAYWYAKALSDYGINIAARWETITQQKAALDSAYVQGRNDEAKCFNNAADVRPVVRGEWIEDCGYHYRCSICGDRWVVSNGNPLDVANGWNYCPNCGADMREEQT